MATLGNYLKNRKKLAFPKFHFCHFFNYKQVERGAQDNKNGDDSSVCVYSLKGTEAVGVK